MKKYDASYGAGNTVNGIAVMDPCSHVLDFLDIS
jgi:hypothetical protein